MTRDWIVLALLAVGQAGGFVVVVNVTHALGLDGRVMDRLKVLLLALALALTSIVAWEATHGPWSTWSWPVRAYALACLVIALVTLPAATLVRAAGGSRRASRSAIRRSTWHRCTGLRR